jgi:SAM-dependent methyltransferase
VTLETWSSGGAYESYVGRWSRLVATEFLEWLEAPQGARWLDVGCGTGALSQAVLNRCRPSSIVGIDASAAYVEHAAATVTDPRAKFRTGDAQELPFEDDAFDVVISGLVLNFVPQPERMASEMARVCRPAGQVAAYVWDYADGMQLKRDFWDAAAALDIQARALDEGVRFLGTRPEPLSRLFVAAGLQDVATRAIDVPTTFADFDDYWQPFLQGQGPAPSYCTSLDADGRAALRDRLQASLPVENDGSIRLTARAWAVKGKTP